LIKYKKSIFISITIVILAIILNLNIGFIKRIELFTYDFKFNLRGEKPLDERIALIYFSNEDIKNLDGWPLKRNYYAYLINNLEKLNPLSVGFLIFLEKESFDYPEYDNLFIETLNQYDNISSVIYFDRISNTVSTFDEKKAISTPAIDIAAKNSPIGTGINFPDKKFANCFDGLGFTNLITDKDGKVRRLHLIAKYYKYIYPNIALQISLPAVSEKNGIDHIYYNEDLKINNFEIDNIEKGEGLINFKASTENVKKYSFFEILDLIENKEYEDLQNKIFLIGVIAEGKSIFHSTPVEANMPFLVVFANAVDNILNNDFIKSVSGALTFLVSLIFALAIYWLIVYYLNIRHIAISVGIFVLFIIINFGLIYGDIYLKLVPGLFLNFYALIAGISVLFSEEKSKRESLEEEKNEIEIALSEREKTLEKLQRELSKIEKSRKDKEVKDKIIEKIEDYKKEIENLRLQVKDREVIELKPQIRKEEKSPDIIYNPGSKIEDILSLVEKVANEDVPILITGESGTGKELIARTIHSCSYRNTRPFIAVNCGALTETLLESELFGHEKGAFTGAVSSKKGRFELADGGTLFLDEITETSLSFQVKLLRVLQEGDFERVGSEETKKVNVRIIAASNKDIKSFVEKKEFREDLYFRINVFTIKLPPLRERIGDMDVLLNHFISEDNTKDFKLSRLAYESLKNYHWPGNIRELKNVIKRALILAKSEDRNIIKLTDMPEEIQKITGEIKKDNLPDLILKKLREEQFRYGSISKTAQELGNINRGTVSEYFRGICFKSFVETDFDIDHTSFVIAGKKDDKIIENVKKKLTEFLMNAIELVDLNDTLKNNIKTSEPKYTNLPKIYHSYLDRVIKAYCKSEWKFE